MCVCVCVCVCDSVAHETRLKLWKYSNSHLLLWPQRRLSKANGHTISIQYGLDFMKDLAPVYTGGETKHGGMITSCICHGCPWPTLELEGKVRMMGKALDT